MIEKTSSVINFECLLNLLDYHNHHYLNILGYSDLVTNFCLFSCLAMAETEKNNGRICNKKKLQQAKLVE
jgi:hypothetical protein